jgi:hypothetical protein
MEGGEKAEGKRQKAKVKKQKSCGRRTIMRDRRTFDFCFLPFALLFYAAAGESAREVSGLFTNIAGNDS